MVVLTLATVNAHAIELADFPLEIHHNAPAPNVMIVWDNSEQMEGEFVTSEEMGTFSGRRYLFPGRSYTPAPDGHFSDALSLNEGQRRGWLSQWSGYNGLYYRPDVTYGPWPRTDRFDFRDADLHLPLSDPTCQGHDCARFKLSDPFFTIQFNGEEIPIPNAHYFVINDKNRNGRRDGDEAVYLVAWQDADGNGRLEYTNRLDDDRRRYFRYVDDGDDRLQDHELWPVADASEIEAIRPCIRNAEGRVVRQLTDAEELQNFANWFTYHRKRIFMAKSALAEGIEEASNLNIGLCAVNGKPQMGVMPVRVAKRRDDARPSLPGEQGADIRDQSEQLLDALYASPCHGPASLRRALDLVGRYFSATHQTQIGPSPYLGAIQGAECQQSHVLLISGSYWEGSFTGVGNRDGGQGAPYADQWRDTLADIAMHYFDTDLAPALDDRTPAGPCGEPPHQHMITHSLWLGGPGRLDLSGLIWEGDFKARHHGGGPCLERSLTSTPQWPLPNQGRPTAADDVLHAAVNSRGHFFAVRNRDGLAAAIHRTAAHIRREGAASGGWHAGPQVVHPPHLYKVVYRSETWQGDVVAYDYDSRTSAAGDDPLWSAAARLNASGRTSENRRILTYGGIWRQPQGIPFRYDDLSEEQKSLLGSDLQTGSPADEDARQLLDFMRGEAVPRFRRRESILGDIVHSVPVVSGQTLFVGSNDGMLHALDTTSGEERLAYVPGMVFDHLNELSSPAYAGSHRFYVDATPTVGEVLVGPYQRQTFLVGGLGKGGRGYFCLLAGSRHRESVAGQFGEYQQTFSFDDIGSDTTEQEIASIVMWEYPRPNTSDDGMDNDGDGLTDESGECDDDMGFSFGQGYAVNANAPEEIYRSVVIFGNGYDSPNQSAVLYVLDATSGMLIRKINTGVAGENGLSVPALIDVNGDRCVDYVYAGDLQGNLWKFDLTDSRPERWGIAYGEDRDGDGVIDASRGDAPRPVFSVPNQPITGRPDVMAMGNACAPLLPGNMVIFGTGRYLGAADRVDRSRQGVYGIWDFGDDSDDSEWLGVLTDRSTGRLSSGWYLHPIEIYSESVAEDDRYRHLSEWRPDYAVCEDTEDGDRTAANNNGRSKAPNPVHYAGWYLALPPGERVVDNVVIRGAKAVVASYVPDSSACASGGESWLYLLDGCGKGTVSQGTGNGLPLPKHFARRLHANRNIIKENRRSDIDYILICDNAGRLIQHPFLGESWGKVFWRQNTQD